MLHRSTIVIAATLALVLGACKGKGPENSDVIKIGQYASLTGKEATFGQEVDEGVKLAVEEINAAGGVNGKKLDLLTEDTQSNKQSAQNAVEKLIGDGVVVLIGEVASGNTMAAAPSAERAKIPMVTPASTNAAVTVDKNGSVFNYIFRICFIDPQQGAVLAKFAHDNLKATTAAILTDKSSPYSTGLTKAFKDAFVAAGGTIVGEQTYEGGQQDFKAQLTSINGKAPQVLFVPGYYTEVGLVAQQARAAGIKAPLLGGDGWDSPNLTKGDAKQALEGSYFSNHFSEQDTASVVRSFLDRFRKKYSKAPGAMSALGYDAMNIVAKVIRDAGGKSDPETIRAGLAGLKDYPGVTGTIAIDAQHNASTKSVVILQIKDGKFTYASTIKP